VANLDYCGIFCLARGTVGGCYTRGTLRLSAGISFLALRGMTVEGAYGAIGILVYNSMTRSPGPRFFGLRREKPKPVVAFVPSFHPIGFNMPLLVSSNMTKSQPEFLCSYFISIWRAPRSFGLTDVLPVTQAGRGGERELWKLLIGVFQNSLLVSTPRINHPCRIGPLRRCAPKVPH